MKARVLPIISITFAALLIVRSASVSSEVISPQAIASELAESQALEPSKKAGLALSPEQCLTGAVLETLNTDITRLSRRTKEIAEREVALAAIENKLKTQLNAIDKANASLQSRIDEIKSIANDDLKHLVSMYQTMKPKDAAEIFNSMDPSFAAGFLREMNSEKAGLIMANMDSRKSYAISVIIAGRNSKYRTSDG